MNEELIESLKNNRAKALYEMLVMVIACDKKNDGELYCVCRDSSYKDHADALNYIYNTKIKKWYGKKLESRERNVYENIIENAGNILFLNTGKGYKLGGILYLPTNITDKQLNELKYFEEGLKYFQLRVIHGDDEFVCMPNEFNIDNIYKTKEKTR